MCWGKGNVRERVLGNVREVWENVLRCGRRCVRVEDSEGWGEVKEKCGGSEKMWGEV